MHKRFMSARSRWLRWLALAWVPACAHAAPPGWTAVAPTALDAMRGGFVVPGGLHLAVGIEQTLTLNGDVVARHHLDLASLGSPASARTVAGALPAGMTLLQNGGANSMLSGFSADANGALVIQNTLNDQRIDSRTVISAAVNSAALLDSLQFQRQLNDALARAVTPQ